MQRQKRGWERASYTIHSLSWSILPTIKSKKLQFKSFMKLSFGLLKREGKKKVQWCVQVKIPNVPSKPAERKKKGIMFYMTSNYIRPIVMIHEKFTFSHFYLAYKHFSLGEFTFLTFFSQFRSHSVKIRGEKNHSRWSQACEWEWNKKKLNSIQWKKISFQKEKWSGHCWRFAST